MEALTKKSKRLSSLLSLNSHTDSPAPAVPSLPKVVTKPAPVPRSRDKSPLPGISKLRKSSGDQTTSPNFSYPNYSPPFGAQQPVQPVQHSSHPATRNSSLTPLDTVEETLLPPPNLFAESASRNGSPANSRPGSQAGSKAGSRPVTPSAGPQSNFPANEVGSGNNKVRRKSNWLGGSKDSKSKGTGTEPAAWIAGHMEKMPYNLQPLLNGGAVAELWNQSGDTDVYLFPESFNRYPSFRIDSSNFSSSPYLTRLVHGRVYSNAIAPDEVPREGRPRPLQASGRQSSTGSVPSSRSQSPEQRLLDSESSGSGSRGRANSGSSTLVRQKLFVPLALSVTETLSADAPMPRWTTDDIEKLTAARNLFAFLVGQSLVATEKRPTVFSIFMRIADMLNTWEFTNFDSSTHGEMAEASFASYVHELHIDDVRISREKTIEAIVLGERMRSQQLFTEGFVHGVGKWDEINNLKSPKITLISAKTQNRMERAAMDLTQRQKNINTRLQDFDFPAIFAGIMNSKTSSERKQVRFLAWKSAFMGARKYFMGYYKHKYGAWPPKASSKKNTLETSGLNRLVLKELYEDMAAVYDVLVDRTNVTTRAFDTTSSPDENQNDDDNLAITRALRKILSEYDRSSPPVQPPMPFDVPLLPDYNAINSLEAVTGNPKKDAKLRSRKLKAEDTRTILKASHNADSIMVLNPQTNAMAIRNPFLAAFFDMEAKCGHNKTVDELIDLRVGHWLLVYSILNTLPMLVVDAPKLAHTAGVEYFLCEVPRSGVPWALDEGRSGTKNWYSVTGSSGVVSLPADIVEHGVEGIYRRSHAWVAADIWTKRNGLMQEAVKDILENVGAGMQTGVARQGSEHGSSSTGGRLSLPYHPGTANLAPPPVLLTPGDDSRPISLRSESPGPAARGKRQSVMMMGLEALPVPAGVAPMGGAHSRPGSISNGVPGSRATSQTFDDILAGPPEKDGKKKKDKKKSKK